MMAEKSTVLFSSFIHRPFEKDCLMPATTGMKGAGYYDQHSTAQMSSIQALQDWLDAAARDVQLPGPPQVVAVVDLGSSEGRNAIEVMRRIVMGLRQRTDQPVHTIYSDLASNNFNQLFANLEQARRGGLFPAEVYPGAVGGSFYGPLLPPGSVHLATSFNAILWLDQLPAVAVPDFVAYRRPQPSQAGFAGPPEAMAAFQQQAERDLVRFLECRARELVPGGKLLLASPGDTDQVRLVDGLFDLLNQACLDLVAAGRLQRNAYERLVMPCYYRTLAEMLVPLEREDSPVYGAFTVDRAEVLEVTTPYIAQFRRDGDVEAFAGAYTGFLRAISEPVVQAAVGPMEEATATLDALYERARARLLAEPERYLWHFFLVAVLLTRR
jgi:hypothetical protein